ncbi:MAG: DUF1566 domain-containing protein [Kiritimatiellae bacterium]|nr:DUF1566 domain-containing protein [Kiritimatiellia bacterium]
MNSMPALSGSGAQPGDILAGKTFWGLAAGFWGEQTGTMATRALSADSTTVQAGYYAATDLAAVDPDLAANNIATNVTLFGIAGCAETNSGGGSAYPAPVGKTGQTTVYRTGDDGSLQMGVEGPDPRFTILSDTVFQDNLTGLMWTRNSAPVGMQNWLAQVTYCNDLSYGGYDDWRMPNIKEMMSIVALGRYNPALASGIPFSNYKTSSYFTSSYHSGRSDERMTVTLVNGIIGYGRWYQNAYVWPVRGGD